MCVCLFSCQVLRKKTDCQMTKLFLISNCVTAKTSHLERASPKYRQISLFHLSLHFTLDIGIFSKSYFKA